MLTRLVIGAVLAAVVAPCAERATVNEDSAPVYSHQRSNQNELVRSLKRGDAVLIDFSIASEGGAWCAVSGPDGRISLGYMLCGHLKRETADEKRHNWRAPRPESIQKPAASPKPPRAPLSMVEEVGDDYYRPARNWAGAFRFSAEQQRAAEGLAGKLGVSACRQQFETHYRTYEAVYTSKDPARERVQTMVQDLNRFLHPCLLKMVELLEQYPGLMTPEQKSNKQLFANFQKQVFDMRRGLTSPDMLPAIR